MAEESAGIRIRIPRGSCFSLYMVQCDFSFCLEDFCSSGLEWCSGALLAMAWSDVGLSPSVVDLLEAADMNARLI